MHTSKRLPEGGLFAALRLLPQPLAAAGPLRARAFCAESTWGFPMPAAERMTALPPARQEEWLLPGLMELCEEA